MENEEEVKLTEYRNGLVYAQILFMPQIYFKVSQTYLQENIPRLLHSLGNTTSTYIDTEPVYVTLYTVLKENSEIDCMACARMVEIKIIDIDEDEEVEEGAIIVFEITDREKRITREVIRAKFLYETRGCGTFAVDIPKDMFEILQG